MRLLRITPDRCTRVTNELEELQRLQVVREFFPDDDADTDATEEAVEASG